MSQRNTPEMAQYGILAIEEKIKKTFQGVSACSLSEGTPNVSRYVLPARFWRDLSTVILGSSSGEIIIPLKGHIPTLYL